ncbi:hypothetical protein CesoFtcFv8_000182 [Champsocephalus esox]|uniref:Uncharacterized protein n=1 Tax=Champsocephalus esox TaxID=159716 RepID=A0AAN8HX15_9TELE|nr:hypothetical protein CesoFtcFv8_000182 [Champsocephalus esox]
MTTTHTLTSARPPGPSAPPPPFPPPLRRLGRNSTPYQAPDPSFTDAPGTAPPAHPATTHPPPQPVPHPPPPDRPRAPNQPFVAAQTEP